MALNKASRQKLDRQIESLQRQYKILVHQAKRVADELFKLTLKRYDNSST